MLGYVRAYTNSKYIIYQVTHTLVSLLSLILYTSPLLLEFCKQFLIKSQILSGSFWRLLLKVNGRTELAVNSVCQDGFVR